MNLENLRNYCLSFKGSTEGFPFDQTTLVFKVSKMFALVDIDHFESVNLKCDPEKAIELREKYGAITPGFHMNKKHWNTVSFNLDVDDKMIYKMIDESYELVVSSLTKKQKAELGLL
jgi:predicted DNA-binding protein (MmcQ/YjbR family)